MAHLIDVIHIELVDLEHVLEFPQLKGNLFFGLQQLTNWYSTFELDLFLYVFSQLSIFFSKRF